MAKVQLVVSLDLDESLKEYWRWLESQPVASSTKGRRYRNAERFVEWLKTRVGP